MASRVVPGKSLVLGIALCACAQSPERQPAPRAITAEPPCDTWQRLPSPDLTAKERAERQTHEATCPMRLPGVTLTSREVSEGLMLQFATSGDVSELQQRVRELATTHAHHGVGASDICGCPLVDRDGTPLMAEASTRAEPAPGGARLLLVSNERSEAARLRIRVAERLAEYDRAACALLPW